MVLSEQTFARTQRAQHAGWVKKIIAQLSGSKWEFIRKDLDVEYATGTAWLGKRKLCSARESLDANALGEVVVDESKAGKPWIRADLIAKEIKCSVHEVKQAFEDSRRCPSAEICYAQLRTAIWYVGGAAIEHVLQAVSTGVGQGWRWEQKGGLHALIYRDYQEWRGEAVAFHVASWSVMRRQCTQRGIWCRLRRLSDGLQVWFGSL